MLSHPHGTQKSVATIGVVVGVRIIIINVIVAAAAISATDAGLTIVVVVVLVIAATSEAEAKIECAFAVVAAASIIVSVTVAIVIVVVAITMMFPLHDTGRRHTPIPMRPLWQNQFLTTSTDTCRTASVVAAAAAATAAPLHHLCTIICADAHLSASVQLILATVVVQQLAAFTLDEHRLVWLFINIIIIINYYNYRYCCCCLDYWSNSGINCFLSFSQPFSRIRLHTYAK